MKLSDKVAFLLVSPLALAFLALCVQVQREKFPIYPMPLHPGTQPIMHAADDSRDYRFKFIGNDSEIFISIADANTNCEGNPRPIARVRGDNELFVPVVDIELHKDICATVPTNEWPMVYECWHAPTNAASLESCDPEEGN